MKTEQITVHKSDRKAADECADIAGARTGIYFKAVSRELFAEAIARHHAEERAAVEKEKAELVAKIKDLASALHVMTRMSESAETDLAEERDEHHCTKYAIVATVKGNVEGAPTHEGNYLQRLRKLVENEASVNAERTLRDRCEMALEAALPTLEEKAEEERGFWAWADKHGIAKEAEDTLSLANAALTALRTASQSPTEGKT